MNKRTAQRIFTAMEREFTAWCFRMSQAHPEFAASLATEELLGTKLFMAYVAGFLQGQIQATLPTHVQEFKMIGRKYMAQFPLVRP